MNRKVLRIAVLLLILSAAAAGARYAQERAEMPSEEEQRSREPEAQALDAALDWKTYENEEYGFAILIPPGTEMYQLGYPTLLEQGDDMPRGLLAQWDVDLQDTDGPSWTVSAWRDRANAEAFLGADITLREREDDTVFAFDHYVKDPDAEFLAQFELFIASFRSLAEL